MSAVALKEEGNAAFKAKHYQRAIELYSAAIDIEPSNPVLLCNRAFAYLRTELVGGALTDANEAIKLDPSFIKAYYRRASALFQMGKYKQAEADFAAVVEKAPRDLDARAKLAECRKVIRALAFAEAIQVDVQTSSAFDQIDIDGIVVEPSYKGMEMQWPLTLDFVKEAIETFKSQRLIHRKFVLQLLRHLRDLFTSLPSLVDVPLEECGMTVCGDTHGQFYDLLNIFDMNGLPSPTNPYVFNGDFVDRGSFSVENVITLFLFKALYPNHVHLTRGNHETVGMNKMYGFAGEATAKYNATVEKIFAEVFRVLPLGVVLGGKSLIVHGGLFSRDGVTLDELRKIDRNCEPPDEGLMVELLWSDPQHAPGRAPSKRGVGVMFGPDVATKFLDENGLDRLIRSHEMQENGYCLHAGGRVITVFSAPNYCDQMGNKGAYVKLRPGQDKPEFVTFSHVKHPDVKAMRYSPLASMGM